jgi:hypothetical protein
LPEAKSRTGPQGQACFCEKKLSQAYFAADGGKMGIMILAGLAAQKQRQLPKSEKL